MPRMPRSQLPSPAWYHVISRGVEQRTIVLDDRDRESLVQAPRRRHEAVSLESARLEPARQPLPPPRRDHPAGAVTRDAAAKRRPRDPLQPSLRPLRPPLPGRFESRVLEGDEHLATVIEYVY